jgi:hypothetical protein
MATAIIAVFFGALGTKCKQKDSVNLLASLLIKCCGLEDMKEGCTDDSQPRRTET